MAVIIDTLFIFPFFFTRHHNLKDAITEALVDIVIKMFYEILLLPVIWLIVAYINYRNNQFYLHSSFSGFYSSVDYLSHSKEEKNC